jgi:hypothetical protein
MKLQFGAVEQSTVVAMLAFRESKMTRDVATETGRLVELEVLPERSWRTNGRLSSARHWH